MWKNGKGIGSERENEVDERRRGKGKEVRRKGKGKERGKWENPQKPNLGFLNFNCDL